MSERYTGTNSATAQKQAAKEEAEQAKNEAAFLIGCAAGLLRKGEERKVYPVIIASGIVGQAQQYTDEELWLILEWLLEFDVAVKTGRSAGGRREVELFCYRLLRVSLLVTDRAA